MPAWEWSYSSLSHCFLGSHSYRHSKPDSCSTRLSAEDWRSLLSLPEITPIPEYEYETSTTNSFSCMILFNFVGDNLIYSATSTITLGTQFWRCCEPYIFETDALWIALYHHRVYFSDTWLRTLTCIVNFYNNSLTAILVRKWDLQWIICQNQLLVTH